MGLQCVIKLSVAFRQDPETNLFVGFCQDLGVYSQGITHKEAEDGLASAINLFLKHGGFEKLMKEKGFNTIKACPERNLAIAGDLIENYSSIGSFDLPAQIRREDAVCQPCH